LNCRAAPRAPLRLKENIGRAENTDETLIPVRAEDPMQLISGGNTLVTPNRHWEKKFSGVLVELAKFVLFGIAWALAVRVLLWPVSLARIVPLLFLCGMSLGLFFAGGFQSVAIMSRIARACLATVDRFRFSNRSSVRHAVGCDSAFRSMAILFRVRPVT
jgi:hypothetical protein